MRKTLIGIFVIIASFAFNGCDSDNPSFKESTIDNSLHEEYFKFINSYRINNHNVINMLSGTTRADNDDDNVIAYLFHLSKEKLDSLQSAYSKYGKKIEYCNEYSQNLIIDSIGLDSYQSYYHYFLDDYINTHSINDLIKTINDKGEFERNLYLATAANIDSNQVTTSNTRHAISSPREVGCLSQLKSDIARGSIQDIGMEVAIGMGLPFAVELIAAGCEAYVAIEAVHKYHNCLMGM